MEVGGICVCVCVCVWWPRGGGEEVCTEHEDSLLFIASQPVSLDPDKLFTNVRGLVQTLSGKINVIVWCCDFKDLPPSPPPSNVT